ncbi:MAG: hypothetical protein JWQ50_8150 [Caballeronia mineralivorans]|nr:hypothetical protein [Caballeronia mineralivorans]
MSPTQFHLFQAANFLLATHYLCLSGAYFMTVFVHRS